MTVLETAEKWLPAGPRLVRALRAEDETARAQRMAAIAFAVRVISAAIAFISQIIQARLMGEFEYGIFVFVWVLVVLAGNFSCLGFHTAVIRFLPQYDQDKADAEIRGLTSTARLFAMTSASILALAGITALHFFGSGIEHYYLVPLFLAVFALPMIALGDVLDGTARANRWAVLGLSPTYIVRPALILAFMLLAVSGGAPATAVTAMQAALAATYLTTLGQFLLVDRRLLNRYDRGDRKIDFAGWFKVALPIFFIEGFGFLLTNSDVIVVGLYLPPDQVAVYFAAAKTMALMQFVFFAVKAGATPRFSTLMAEGNSQGLAGFAGTAARWSFWPSLAVGVVVLMLGDMLLGLFGSAFTAGYLLMVILFAGNMAKALVGPAEMLLTMAGRQQLCVAVYAVALACNIGLNITLIPAWGLAGAATATATAMVVEAMLLHIAVRRALGIVVFAFADPHALTPPTEAVRQ
ncbi:lipopolysaccharide biosynthesis protein [Agrobacterium sp. RAC06]|uniref:lipopolysaccharide biosynthesis protein n=1 Tax=Agrobacterium sp. RAC06 TaxID=1842536 RepID=UPI00083E3862|nr:lipopolysaccharide biosynthesis protein [Agrobacterium sp. RAC06]AOG12015.1 polysaccharide biosynthesis family protein [Agrobacterium sp. RAC06]